MSEQVCGDSGLEERYDAQPLQGGRTNNTGARQIDVSFKCVWALHVCMSVHHMHEVPEKARRRHWIPRN